MFLRLERRFQTSKLLHALPTFEVPNGIGGALHISIPPGQNLIVQRGCVLSMPAKVSVLHNIRLCYPLKLMEVL
jgi:hypothetical protein